MADKVDKLRVGDARATKKFTEVKGRRWYYLDAPATTSPQKGTIFLFHGFPDISFAWRYQIPMLTALGLRCIALDCMGYGDTGSSSRLEEFSFKNHADATAGIARALNIHKAVIGGHDWGGILVYRVAQWYPDLITHVFSVCTPFSPAGGEGRFLSTRELAEGVLPQFGYQLQSGSEDQQVEKAVDGKEERMRKLLNGLYGGKISGGKRFMDPLKGIDLSIVEDEGVEVKGTKLMSEEEIDHYVKEFMKNGINGPCNWYRTRKINWEEERALPADRRVIKQPTLYVLATRDDVLTREMSKGMEKMVPNLTRGEVPAGHWALWQTPDQTNKIIEDWVKGVVFGEKSKL